MEFDRVNQEELEGLIETLGGVNLEIIDGSSEVLAEAQASREELLETYQQCNQILTDVLDFGLWFLRMDDKERRAVRKDIVRGNRSELNIL